MIDIEAGLARAREIEPMLTVYGIGVQDTQNTKEDLDAGFKQIRKDHLKKVCEILIECKKNKNINEKHSSYGLKHFVEKAIEAYTSNGELIAAMLICGFIHKIEGYHRMRLNPNASFNIAEKSVKWLISQDKHTS